MTASLFKITPTPPTVIALEPGGDGKFSFTIESLAAPGRVHEIMLQALLVGPHGKSEEVDWLVVGPARTLIVSGGKTETVTITARPDADTPRGQHRIKLVIADRDRPNDVYADSSPVSLEVKIPIEEQESPPPKKLWWLIAAIAGGILLVGGGVLVFVLAGDDEPALAALGETCRGPDGKDGKECAEGFVCTGGGAAGVCLLAGGAACTPAGAALCASRECVSGRLVCAIPAGGPCDPDDKALVPAVPCARNLVCNASTKTCRSRFIRPNLPDLPIGTIKSERLSN